ncbi:hypothetical protein [Pseudoruegeria sp. HB172150]|uniref:TsoY family (seleno)protein n=1 Tax=Pseudoruegeria sp. HB172150 TaxID=2721164 RepID=UPI001551FE31|nr:hypothetical protein [Pseudoruegeria sp. HB172150]
MPRTATRPADRYSPLYFLGALGAGGLAVTFFMYLMFWVPHPGRAVPNFEDIAATFTTGGPAIQTAIAVAMAGIAVFVVLHFKSLIWNLRQYSAFKKTEAYQKLKASNAETQLLAMPLALAMAINAGFVAGLVFVPGLWSIVEFLFPFAMVAFTAVGILALIMIGDFLGRVLTKGGVFDVTAHNSFAQLLPAFALTMTAVGFAAPAAMSTVPLTQGISLIGSTFFGMAGVIYAAVAAITAFNSMLHYGTAKESGPTLMIIVPLLTILGILAMRQGHGLHVSFDAHAQAADTLMFLTRIVAVQVLFLLLGMLVLRRQGYFQSFVFGSENSPGAYALVCPGVAMSVMLHFWINKGLVANGLVEKFSTGYWALTALAIAFQIAMIWLVFHLNRRHFGKPVAGTAVPAE